MSKIEWTERTWNPIIGCSKVSEGCANCYAETMATRLSCNPKAPIEYQSVITNKKWNGTTELVRSALEIPLKRKKPTIYFVGSMTDLFHESVKTEWLDKVFWIMGMCSQHRFILLTKRPDLMQAYLNDAKPHLIESRFRFPFPNIILGVTAENQEQANIRVPVLLNTPAAARFVSIEPMLGAVDLQRIQPAGKNYYIRYLEGLSCDNIDLYVEEKIDWVICGGESGPNARPMHPDWARSLRDQCKEASIPFFFKQWGEWAADGQVLSNGKTLNASPITEKWDIFEDGQRIYRVGKKAAGNLLDGQEYSELPAILEVCWDA